jgi:hypothetical protein
MKKIFPLTFSIGAILILIAALFKEMHWQGEKELMLAGIIILLIAMVLFIVFQMRKDNKPHA